MAEVAAVIGAFIAIAAAFVISLILHSEIQAVHQTEEVAVAIGCNAVGAAGHIVIGEGVGVATEFRQHIRPGFHVVKHTIVTTIIKGTVVAKLQASEAKTRPGLIVAGVGFGVVRLNLIFPLTIACQLIGNLGFAFKADTQIGLIAIGRRVIGKIVQRINLAIQIELITVFIINFCGVSGARC